MKVMQTRIMLSPYDPKKRLCLITDGVKTIGTGFVLCQYVNENNPSQGVNIIHSGARKFDSGRIYSPVEAEDIALKQAISECHYLIYYEACLRYFSNSNWPFIHYSFFEGGNTHSFLRDLHIWCNTG